MRFFNRKVTNPTKMAKKKVGDSTKGSHPEKMA
jgi:hypothetical protein